MQMDKKELRAFIREQKRAMTQEQIQQKSHCLTQLFLQTEQYAKASAIYGYLPYNQEVRTCQLLRQALADGKRVAVPKVFGEEMRFLWIEQVEDFPCGYCGIPEPEGDGPVAQDPYALVLMPGLAFDRQGHRIGYGGGFYDRFLQEEPTHPTVALCYDFQLVPNVPVEALDVSVDLVLWA